MRSGLLHAQAVFVGVPEGGTGGGGDRVWVDDICLYRMMQVDAGIQAHEQDAPAACQLKMV